MDESRVGANILTGDDVLIGLLDYGLFCEKVPPCFTSKGLVAALGNSLDAVFTGPDERSLKDALNKCSHDYIRYESMRDINIPRHLGIPHPESYAVQALAIKKHWDEIQKHCAKPASQVSRVHVRRMGGGRIFEMNYKGTERFQLEEDEIRWMAGAMFVVNADISACFPSIYTHSIPWALHGRNEAKANRGLLALSGNLLDRCTQNTRDGQTNGLLIGPHASNIISEIILTRIDDELLRNGYKKLKRHIDDYEFYADSYDEAERFLHDLRLVLRDYELTVNEKKTGIHSLPRLNSELWVSELNRFNFPKGEDIKFSTIRSFLDLALELATTAGTSAPLNYAIKMVPERLNQRAKRLYVQEAINLALVFPYLAPILDKHVFDKYVHDGIDATIAEFSNKLIRLGIKKLYPDAIAHGLYYSLKYGIVLDMEQKVFEEMLQLDDCLVTVLLLEYANKQRITEVQTLIKKRLDNHLKSTEKSDIDRQWLFIYQTWSENELRNKGQQVLADLKKLDFKFILSDVFDKGLSTPSASGDRRYHD